MIGYSGGNTLPNNATLRYGTHGGKSRLKATLGDERQEEPEAQERATQEHRKLRK